MDNFANLQVDLFPTNPINALEARRFIEHERSKKSEGFQLIQLTHWKREKEEVLEVLGDF